jgi:hypothetical protein
VSIRAWSQIFCGLAVGARVKRGATDDNELALSNAEKQKAIKREAAELQARRNRLKKQYAFRPPPRYQSAKIALYRKSPNVPVLFSGYPPFNGHELSGGYRQISGTVF